MEGLHMDGGEMDTTNMAMNSLDANIEDKNAIDNGSNYATHKEDLINNSKRAALAGQWRTPPLPVFPTATSLTTSKNTSYETNAAGGAPDPISSSSSSISAAVTEVSGRVMATFSHQHPTTSSSSTDASIPSIPLVNKLPDSTEDYAKALQEAYRRGAEAAAALAAQQPGMKPFSMSAAVSCPDFLGTGSSSKASGVSWHQPAVQMEVPIESAEEKVSSDNVIPILPPPVPDPLSVPSATMPPPPPIQTTVPTALTTPAVVTQSHQQQQQSLLLQQQQQQQRSISLPDMTSYAAQQEEEKRQKRLARNRASARLRRLRKKNLVDAYEAEVGILERTLQQLRAHEWGAQDDAPALVDALSMDRGQQILDIAERKQAAADILQQQLDFLQQLEELMQEQYVLHHLKDSAEFDDLKQALQLSDDQLAQLQAASVGWDEEWAALQTVKASLQAMKDNDWLWNESVSSVADQFMSVLHSNQVSKFLLWADHNAEAIDELDGVNAAAAVPQTPVFHFGVDSTPDGLLDDEK